jgi:hypothetical protein
MKISRQFPTRVGRPVPTVPVPIPLVAAAAMLGAFALGRATGSIRGTGRCPCREEERTVNGEEAGGA